MMNPIISQMMTAALGNNPIMKMFQTVFSAKDRNITMQSLAQQNPQLKQTLDYINQNGGNAKQLFYQMAQQRNADTNAIINQLNTYMKG